jgi:hypothetical protein
MTVLIPKSTSGTPLLFFMVQSADHITALTGASPTVTISKNGAAFASPSGAVTEIANGWYQVAGNATDTNTAGPIALHATAASGDPSDMIAAMVLDPTVNTIGANLINIAGSAISTSAAQLGVNVVQYNAQTAQTDANNLPKVDVEDWKGAAAPAMTGDAFARLGAPAGASVSADIAAVKSDTGAILTDVNTGAGAIYTRIGAPVGASIAADIAAVKSDLDAGVTVATNNDKSNYTITSNVKKNTAQSAFMFLMTDSTTHAPKTGLTVTATRSIDGAAFAACANSATEVSGGWYTIALATTDVNGNDIALRFTAAGADDCDIKFKTQP